MNDFDCLFEQDLWDKKFCFNQYPNFKIVEGVTYTPLFYMVDSFLWGLQCGMCSVNTAIRLGGRRNLNGRI